MGWQTCCSYLRGKYMTWTWTLFGQNQACNKFNSILILMSVWHATVHQHPVRAEADIIVRCYAPTNSGKSDKVAHSAVESPRGAQTNAQMLRVNGLQHVPDPWQPSSEAWIWKPRNLCCAGARTLLNPLNRLNRLNPLLLHIAGQNIEEKLPMGQWGCLKANLQYLHHHSETKLVSGRNQWCFAKHCCRGSC